jgi:CheY-like chemotaxis protein
MIPETTISPSSSRAGPPIMEHGAEAPLVLVADDHDDSRCIARIVLETSGFRVVEACTGREALAMARALQPVATVLDIVMPELTGWEVARALRADEPSRQLVIIALTALSDPSDRIVSMASGCDAMLVKPIHPRALTQVVRRQLARRARAEARR